MRLLLAVFTIVVFSFFQSCNGSQKQRLDNQTDKAVNIIIDLDQMMDPVNCDDIIDSVSYIPLEDTQPLIGNFEKVLFYRNNIIIWDKTGKKVWIFDNAGKYISRISKMGKGPGEYLTISDISIGDKGEISIVDPAKKAVLKYNLQGDFLKRQIYEGWPENYIRKEAYEYVFFPSFSEFNDSTHFLSVYYNNDKVKSYFKANHNWFYSQISRFHRFNNEIFFYNSYDKFIYELDKDELIPAYSLTFKNHNFDDLYSEILNAMSLDEYEEITKSKFLVGNFNHLTITNRKVMFSFIVRENEKSSYMGVCIYDKLSEESICYKSNTSSKNKLGVFISGMTDGTYHYILTEPYRMDKNLRSKISKEFGMNIRDESNSILVKYLYK